jgi:hypothetical protein
MEINLEMILEKNHCIVKSFDCQEMTTKVKERKERISEDNSSQLSGVCGFNCVSSFSAKHL